MCDVPRHVVRKFDGPSVGLPLTKGRAVAVGVKTGNEVKLVILEGEFELPADLGRTLKKRIRDLDDKRKYVIASKFSKNSKHWLYYDAESDCYLLGDLQRASVFKRRAIAAAVMALLRSEWHEIV